MDQRGDAYLDSWLHGYMEYMNDCTLRLIYVE